MDRATFFLRIAILGLFFTAACATDNPGDSFDDRMDPNSCSNPCEAGESQCNGNTIQVCAADTRGCLSWSDGVSCDDEGAMCDDSAEPAICLTEPGTCQDGEVNQDESDTDCGGQRCEACGLGDTCLGADDCQSGNCDLGVTDECVDADTPTCTDGELNQDETDVDCGGPVCNACEEGATCTAATDCASGMCDENGECAPGGGPCNNGEVQCVGNTVQTCQMQQWVESQICAQGCDQGACADEVQCMPGAERCFKNSVQQCNTQGTAWAHLDICEDECDQGLCVGACEPNALRCNGDVQELCGMDGSTWNTNENCTLGCSHRVCIEADLKNMGVPMMMSGTHVYQECVSVELGGSIEVPAGETLEIWAKCLEVTSSSYITLGADAQFIFHAAETINNEGSISGGAFVRLDAYQTLTNAGDVSSDRVELRGDVLNNSTLGTIGGGSTFALYGSEWTNDGTHDGATSVMPPETLSSPTHPEGFQWNMVDDDVSIAWNKPFDSARGYYVNVNTSEVPGPSSGEFSTVENVTLPLAWFRPGQNTVQVVSVNADSTVGTVPATFVVDFNISSPIVSSSSHGDPFEWSNSDDVFIEWTEAPNVDPNSYTGYWYVWDHRGDTDPDDVNGTFRNDDKILFDSVAPGVWTFHLSSIDRLGRTSAVPGRYEVRVGPEPGYGNIAGNVTDSTGEPLRGATVLLNGGIYRTTTVASGDFTFRGEVPAVAFDWEVKVVAPGYTQELNSVRMTDGGVEVLDFTLQPSNVPPSYELSFPVMLSSNYSHGSSEELDIALGRPGEFIWSTPDEIQISSTGGAPLRYIGSPNGSSYGRADVGFDNNHYFSTYVYYTGGAYQPRIQLFDSTHGEIVNQYFNSWSPFFSPSMVWDGTRFVVVGGDYDSIKIGAVDLADPTNQGEWADTIMPSESSNLRTKALYDGAAVAVAFVSYDDQTGDYYPFLGRWTRDGSQVGAPVRVPEVSRYANPVGLAFDGTNFHVGFKGSERKANDKYPLYIQQISTSGTLGDLTEIDDDTDLYQAPMLAFDGRNLLVVYESENSGHLKILDPDNHQEVESFPLGDARYPNIDFGFHTGQGAIIYSDYAAGGLFARILHVQ